MYFTDRMISKTSIAQKIDGIESAREVRREMLKTDQAINNDLSLVEIKDPKTKKMHLILPFPLYRQ
jgi:hypothetical protein